MPHTYNGSHVDCELINRMQQDGFRLVYVDYTPSNGCAAISFTFAHDWLLHELLELAKEAAHLREVACASAQNGSAKQMTLTYPTTPSSASSARSKDAA